MEPAIAIFFSDLRETMPNITDAVRYLANTQILKGGVLMALFFFSIARPRATVFSSHNLHVVRSAAAIVIAMFIGRILQLALPHRNRPNFFTEERAPDTYSSIMSSFPSDHAVLMTCISMAIFLRNRTIGMIAFVWTLAAILAPRIYLGLHHPTDILAGMLIGGGVAWAMIRAPAPAGLRATIEKLEHNYAVPLYFLAILFAVEVVRNFEDARAVARMVLDII